MENEYTRREMNKNFNEASKKVMDMIKIKDGNKMEKKEQYQIIYKYKETKVDTPSVLSDSNSFETTDDLQNTVISNDFEETAVNLKPRGSTTGFYKREKFP